MNIWKNVTLVVALLVSVATASAITTPLNITVQNGGLVAYSTLPSNYGDATVFNWLAADVVNYNTLTGSSLVAPVAGFNSAPLFKQNVNGGTSLLSVNFTGSASYIFLHWGGQAGPSQAFYIGGFTGAFDFNAPGQNPAVGGISFYSLYGPSTTSNIPGVPDGGTTIALLGGALSLVGIMRRKLKA